MTFAMLVVRRILRYEYGQDLIEYALLGALIATAAVIAMTATGTSVNALLQPVADRVTSSVPAAS